MATSHEAQAVKTLNTTPGRRNRRFVFKSFAQRIEELDVNVFRSLDTLKAEPVSSSFFLDCLTHWRELNTAEDFISFYEEMMPLVQTLPLVLVHKDLIIAELLSRLQLKARLSLEPILRLISELSRDLQKDFLLFLPKVIQSYLALLEDGADREPDIVEQIFTSWSYIIMYLQKYLTQDIRHILKVTVKLRFYGKDFVREFMAMALSYLLRNAAEKQFSEGIRRVVREAARLPSDARKSGISALLWHVMRGTSSRFHSRAQRLLHLLLDSSTLSIGDRFTEGSEAVVEIVSTAFKRACMEVNPTELKLLWECLYEEFDKCGENISSTHLCPLLSVLISTVAVDGGRKVSDYDRLLKLVGSLVQAIVVPNNVGAVEGQVAKATDKILELMLCILDGIYSSHYLNVLPQIALQWAPAFQLRTSSLLMFLKGLINKDYALLAFRSNILSGLLALLEKSMDGGVYVLLTFCERLQAKTGICEVLDGTSDEVISELRHFFKGAISSWEKHLDNMADGDASSGLLDKEKLALLWGIICCIPYLFSTEGKTFLLSLEDKLDKILSTEADIAGGIPKQVWQSLIGASLYSYQNAVKNESHELQRTSRILYLARKYRSSCQILSAAAEYFDLVYGSILNGTNNGGVTHPELAASRLVDALDIFSDNLLSSDKQLRVSTLKILCHYELMTSKQAVEQRIDMGDIDMDAQSCNVFHLLLMIEETPVSVATGRKLVLLVSRIQTCLLDAKTPEAYVLPAVYGIIGLLYNQFMDLSNSALDCLSATMTKHPALLWEKFIGFFELCQAVYLKNQGLKDRDVQSLDEAAGLEALFSSFCHTVSFERSCSLIVTMLLKALQKSPTLAESHSREIVPLFLKFMGYRNEDSCVESFDFQACKAKDWKHLLVEWLILLKLMKNSRSFYRSQILKEVLVNRLLDDNDADIQSKVLDCLLNWKDGFLLPYEKHLKNLVSSKFLREELATWSLSKDSNLIEAEHRAQLVPLVTRLLMPKVRNLRTLASRKHASVNNRKAVLGFIAQLGVEELSLFILMLMKSLQIEESGSDDMAKCVWDSEKKRLDERLLDLFTVENILSIPWKKKYGFLHVIEEIFGIFGAIQVKPFLNLFMGCVVRILQSCALRLCNIRSRQSAEAGNCSSTNLPIPEEDDEAVNLSAKQVKDMRSLCLKIISFGLNKYEDHEFGSSFWDLFFESVKPLIHAFKQEGSSSEKPSSLFFCFLAMSQSQNLVLQLCRDKNLIPNIFSILSVPTASEAIVTGVLKFIENLLTLEVEHGMENSAIREVLVSNVVDLINNLHHLFQNTEKARKLLKHPGETILRVFRLLSKFIKDLPAARKFVDILLPLACDVKSSDLCMEVWQILRDIVPLLSSESTSIILNAVSPVLVSARLELRLSICDLFDTLAKSDSSICSMAKLVRDLNSISKGDLDFDIIISAYEKITANYFCDVREEQTLVILSHCIYDMTSEEIILRQSAYRSLLSFVEFSARIVGKDVPEHKMAVDNSCWTAAHIQHVVNKFLLKHMGNAMNREAALQKEWIDLLHVMVLKLTEVPSLNTLRVLCNEDAEVDFFNNIVHLQKHRRSRALSRFSNVVANGKFSEFVMKKVFLPLFFNMLFDLPTGKGENIRSACMDAIASVSRKLGWKSYYALLMRCFREIAKKPDREKVLIRLVCCILDQFHFSERSCSQGSRFNSTDVIKNNAMETSDLVTSPDCDRSSAFLEIQSCLTGNVLPKLQNLLKSDTDKVNVNVSVAVLKVLKLLPGDTMDSQLSSIIHRISNFLRNRLESVRDEARSALAACLKELGVEYLKFVVKVLMATLKRGFELHVLGYTLNFILSKGLQNSVGGELDYCLNELLTVVGNDIFGEVAEQKEVDKIASKMKETRKRMSFGTLKLIAQNVTFKTHGLKLLSVVTNNLQKHLTPKMKSKLEMMLAQIAEGIEINPSVNQSDLFVFVYSIVDDWLSEERHKSEMSLAQRLEKDKQCEESSDMVMKCFAGSESQWSYLISVFALGLLNNRLRKIKFSRGNDQLLSMLDPFVKQLTSCLSCKYEEIITAALKCIFPLVRLPLPSLESQADKIKVTLLDIAQSSSNVNSLVVQSCLKLLTALLRSAKITLSTEQLHVLIQFPVFVDLEKNPSFVALTLLKAIVRRKLVVHELYDLVTQVSELMVTSQEEAIRRKCSQILLQFLLNYPLSQKRRQQHLDFLIASLRYEHPSGREAVLDMLKTVIKRFPDGIINEQSQTLFVHLVLALANDRDNKVRSLIGIVIKVLLNRVSSQARDSIVKHCLALYLGEKPKLWSTAAQILGFTVEVMQREFQKHMNAVLPVMKRIMLSSITALNDGQLNISDQETIPFWKETYYSLVMLEKILTQMPDLYFLEDIEDIWMSITEFLTHPHPWICDICIRLVALYFEQIGIQGKKLGTTCLTSTSRLFLIGAGICGRLMVQVPDKGARKLVKCNLAFAICGLQSLLRQTESQDPHMFWSTLAPQEQRCCLKACHLLGPDIRKNITAAFTCEFDDEAIEAKDRLDLSYLLVSGLLNTMGKTALQAEDVQCKMILGSFKLIATQMSYEDCQQYTVQFLLPVYKLCEGYSGKVVSDAVKQSADKVRQKIQDILGAQNFIQAYNQIRQSLGEKRLKRKREEKVLAVVNPVRHAKRKIRMSAKSQANKKRKMFSTKMGRWMH